MYCIAITMLLITANGVALPF